MKKKIYYAWKDGKKNINGEQEWTEITGKEYLEICKASKDKPIEKRRLFMKISEIEEGDTSFFFECDTKDYLKYRAEKEKNYRTKVIKQREELKYGPIQVVSFDAEYADASGDTYSLHELIEDKESLFEDKLVQSVDLRNALNCLNDEERKVINALFLSENAVSEREYAKQIGVSKTQVHYKKEKTFEKIKRKLDQN